MRPVEPAKTLSMVRKLFVGLWLSRHVDRPLWELPIVGNLRSRIIRPRGARLEVGGRLRMGDVPTYLGYVARGMAVVLELQRNATLVFEGDATLGDGTKILVGPGAEVRIGPGTFFDGDSRVMCVTTLAIGADCAIAWDVLIMDADFHRIDGRASGDAPITIGDHVWIGASAKVLKGVTVGDGAVIAAGAIVTRDVPPRALVAGSPVRVVREGVVWD
jgi:acetyltransferase-like isoleucine patch superfamily enzyme